MTGLPIDDGKRVAFDLTVNVPTILTLTVMLISGAATGIRIYGDLDSRVSKASYEISNIQERMRTFEATMAAIKSNNDAQIQDLRSDIRADLTEIKTTLRELLLSRYPNGAKKQWLPPLSESVEYETTILAIFDGATLGKDSCHSSNELIPTSASSPTPPGEFAPSRESSLLTKTSDEQQTAQSSTL